ncbi:hypothetical protein [Nonomuraea typhae]|uniref:hypothetical protein n=1 Tax=Nonomuraea typhae TaxID=2603600 RepID=UPI0012F86F7B|nr:hypothetical protein [Nonomuraea typhae]
MSPPRSGLIRGLVIGFIAMPVAGAAYTAAWYGFWRLPYDLRWIAGEPKVSYPYAGGLIIALVLGLTFWLIRSRSLIVPLVAALYAFGARVIASVATSVLLSWQIGYPLDVLDEHLVLTLTGLPAVFGENLVFWGSVATAVVPVYLLTLLRAVRLRRRARRETPPVPTEPRTETAGERDPFEPAQPSEQRGAFEPLQAPAPRPGGDMFTTPPSDPGQPSRPTA